MRLVFGTLVAMGTTLWGADFRSCPGGFAGDLTVKDCTFSMSTRFEKLVAGSMTDQAILGAVLNGAIAELRQDPAEWKRSWKGMGQRVGSRYAQGIAKGSTEFLVGAALREDPRPIRCADDPKLVAKMATDREGEYSCGVWKRIGHAMMDSVTVRRSQEDGQGGRRPAFSRFAGAYASGFTGYAYLPDHLNTPGEASKRAANAFVGTIASSFYHEFTPEVNRLLGILFKRGAVSKPAPKQGGK